MDQIKILIVDDHPMMRDALKMAFTGEDDLQVIGEATDPIEALKMLATLSPNVILMDLLMPNMGGVEAIEEVLKLNPQECLPEIFVFVSFPFIFFHEYVHGFQRL